MSPKEKRPEPRHSGVKFDHPERDLLDEIAQASQPAAEELVPVGERIRRLRQRKGLSLTDVAQRTGMSEDTLEQIETDAVAPPLGTLIKLARALEMKMGQLLTDGEARPFVITRKDQGRPVSRRAAEQQKRYGYSYLSLAAAMRDRNMEPFLVTLAPTAEEMPGSVHEGEEFIYVLDGEMEVIIGAHRDVLGPGDCIYYRSTVPHLVKCRGDQPARILAVLFAEAD